MQMGVRRIPGDVNHKLMIIIVVMLGIFQYSLLYQVPMQLTLLEFLIFMTRGVKPTLKIVCFTNNSDAAVTITTYASSNNKSSCTNSVFQNESNSPTSPYGIGRLRAIYCKSQSNKLCAEIYLFRRCPNAILFEVTPDSRSPPVQCPLGLLEKKELLVKKGSHGVLLILQVLDHFVVCLSALGQTIGVGIQNLSHRGKRGPYLVGQP